MNIRPLFLHLLPVDASASASWLLFGPFIRPSLTEATNSGAGEEQDKQKYLHGSGMLGSPSWVQQGVPVVMQIGGE